MIVPVDWPKAGVAPPIDTSNGISSQAPRGRNLVANIGIIYSLAPNSDITRVTSHYLTLHQGPGPKSINWPPHFGPATVAA
jgi:hypothetical protein